MTSNRFGELMQPVGRDRIDNHMAPVTLASPLARNAARQVLVAVVLNACVRPSQLLGQFDAVRHRVRSAARPGSAGLRVFGFLTGVLDRGLSDGFEGA